MYAAALGLHFFLMVLMYLVCYDPVEDAKIVRFYAGVRDTGYDPFQVCLLSRFSLLLACVGCVEIDDSNYFYSFRHDGRLKRGSMPHPEPPVSRLRYAPQATHIRPNACIQVIAGLPRSFKAIP